MGKGLRAAAWAAVRLFFRGVSPRIICLIHKITDSSAQCLESLKPSFLIEIVEGLQAEDKIIIFCEYISTVNAMHGAFPLVGIKAVCLVGADPAMKWQKAIDTRQDDHEVRVSIGSTRASGVGITVTAANCIYAMDPGSYAPS